jgi:hypothetical protein
MDSNQLQGEKMKIKTFDVDLSVCKLPDCSQIKENDSFCFLGKTDEEISFVCRSSSVPANALACDSGWKCFKVIGPLDFSLIGILADISSLLAAHDISIFAISTFDTDYVLTKKENFRQAISLLEEHGYTIES